MKKIHFLLTVIAGFLFSLLSSAMSTEGGKFYYAFEEKTPLFPKKNTLLIKYVDGFNKTEAEEFIKTKISSNFEEKWHNAQTVEITTEAEAETNTLMEKLKSSGEVYTCQPFYT